ncbi:MAG TPA: M48 family metalloprotease [Terracidiphilus sp.]|nr:M48 family metalloprotease [Terracidiphilus sp.]
MNIFNDRQEQDLADALAEYFESDMRIATPAADDQLTRIGERLLATLPPNGIQYRLRMYDSGEINGFSIGGGRVYISRKLITAVKSEDELAGVVAHEIGHLAVHQSAIEMTRMLRIRLGVTHVGDRADIFARVHQLLNTPAKPDEDDRHDERGELTADNVAVYAMVRAGYAPEAFATFFDRVTENKGKTSNWFADVFGITSEERRRYTEALQLIATLPPVCRGQHQSNNAAFQVWVRGVLEGRVNDVASGSVNEATIKLDPPLRPTFWRIRFSPDGKLLLGQDEGSIVVADRESGGFRFRIDAPGAKSAYFTPDSKSVVFHDTKLRVERWDVATGKQTSVKEVVVFSGCNQTVLSADGRSLACLTVHEESESLRVSLQIVDVGSGALVYDKKNFFEQSTFDLGRLWQMAANITDGDFIANVAISPDGHYLLLATGDKSLAFDFEKQQPVALEGKLKNLGQTRMSFVGPNQVAVVGDRKSTGMYPLRIMNFPDGQLVKELEIGDQIFRSSSKPGTLIIGPLKSFAVGLLDVDAEKISWGSKFDAIDAWGPYASTENAAGGFAVLHADASQPQAISVDLGPLPEVNRGMISRDGRFLAVSLKNRAAIWDLDSGKQIALIRPFSSAWIDDQDALIGQFPKYGKWDAQELKFKLDPLNPTELGKLDNEEWQYHNLELRFRPMGKGKEVNWHATLEVKKMDGQSVAWTRGFNQETPACWPAEDDRLVLAWDLSNSAVKAEIKAHPELEKELAALKGRKGLLLETVTPETGASLEQVVVPEADLTNGRNDVRQAIVSGDVVLARGEHENTTIYRLKDGSKVGEFFGHPVATDAGLHLIAAVNRENEILLVDEATGKELKRFTLSSPVRVARIVGNKDKTLLVLTADQVIHRVAVP